MITLKNIKQLKSIVKNIKSAKNDQIIVSFSNQIDGRYGMIIANMDKELIVKIALSAQPGDNEFSVDFKQFEAILKQTKKEFIINYDEETIGFDDLGVKVKFNDVYDVFRKDTFQTVKSYNEKEFSGIIKYLDCAYTRDVNKQILFYAHFSNGIEGDDNQSDTVYATDGRIINFVDKVESYPGGGTESINIHGSLMKIIPDVLHESNIFTTFFMENNLDFHGVVDIAGNFVLNRVPWKYPTAEQAIKRDYPSICFWFDKKVLMDAAHDLAKIAKAGKKLDNDKYEPMSIKISFDMDNSEMVMELRFTKFAGTKKIVQFICSDRMYFDEYVEYKINDCLIEQDAISLNVEYMYNILNGVDSGDVLLRFPLNIYVNYDNKEVSRLVFPDRKSPIYYQFDDYRFQALQMPLRFWD